MTRALTGSARATANALHLNPDVLAPILAADPALRDAIARAEADADYLVRLRDTLESLRPSQAPEDAPGTAQTFHMDPESTDVVRWARDTAGIDLAPLQAEALAAYFAQDGGELLLRWGRQSGKSTVLAIAAAYIAAYVEPYRALVPRGTLYAGLLIANSLDQARPLLERIATFLDVPGLRERVESVTNDEIALAGDIRIAVLPASARTIRGRTAALVGMDEAAHALESEGPQAARALYRALVPSIARFGPLGRVVLSSTPHTRVGLFWDHVQRAEHGDAGIVYRTGATVDVFPGALTPERLAELEATDPDLAREYRGDWLDASSAAFLDPVQLDACIRPAPLWWPRENGRSVIASLDPAFSAGGDAFALAVGWREGERIVVAGVDAWKAGRQRDLDVDAVLEAAAARCRDYGATYAITDQGMSPPVIQGLERRGVTVVKRPLTSESKWAVVSALRSAVSAGRVELPPDPELRRELLGLALSVSPSGRPQVAAAGSGHDDRALAVATLVYELGEYRTGVLLHV